METEIKKYNQRILKAVGVRDIYHHLTANKIYTTLYGIEEGIFKDRPFVTVIDDNGKKYSCHYDRFIDITEE